MSYIAAVGAKNKANAFINDSYRPVDTVSAAMSANAARNVAETENEAQRNYFGEIGDAKLDSIKKIGSAQASAANDAFFGDMAMTIGSAAMGVSSYGQGAGWFDKGGSLPTTSGFTDVPNTDSGFYYAPDGSIQVNPT